MGGGEEGMIGGAKGEEGTVGCITMASSLGWCQVA